MVDCIQKNQIKVHKIFLASLSSALLFDIYRVDDDTEVDCDTIKKLMMHYYYVKENKEIQMHEFVWRERPT